MAGATLQHAGRVVAEAKTVTLRDLSSDTLALMLREARDEQTRIAESIQREGEALEEARQAGQWGRLQDARDRILLLQDELGETHADISRLSDAYQHNYLDERVLERLGARWKVTALEVAILLLIGAVLVVLGVDRGFELTDAQRNTLAATDTIICVVFLAEFLWRMRFAESKAWYWSRYWIDFVASLPLAGVLRIGRVARLARVIRAARVARTARMACLCRGLRSLAFLSRGFDKIAGLFSLQVFSRPLILTIGVLLVGGWAIARLEQGHSGGAGAVDSFWGGIWWSFTTVITGGFSAVHSPESAAGRLLTAFLIILGIVLTGALTAGLANILLGDETARIERKQAAMQGSLEQTASRVERIEARLTEGYVRAEQAPSPDGQ